MSQRTKRNRRGSTNQSNHNYLSDQSSKHKTSSIKRSHKRDVSVHDCCDGCKCELDQETIDFYKQYMMDNVYSTSPYRLRNFHLAIDLVLFAIGAVYVVLAPFTKVEESFNMQATHDMLFHGYTNLEAYDHMQFPGTFPRTLCCCCCSLCTLKYIASSRMLFILLIDNAALLLLCGQEWCHGHLSGHYYSR